MEAAEAKTKPAFRGCFLFDFSTWISCHIPTIELIRTAAILDLSQKSEKRSPVVVAYAFNSSTQEAEAEAGRSLRVRGQPGL